MMNVYMYILITPPYVLGKKYDIDQVFLTYAGVV